MNSLILTGIWGGSWVRGQGTAMTRTHLTHTSIFPLLIHSCKTCTLSPTSLWQAQGLTWVEVIIYLWIRHVLTSDPHLRWPYLLNPSHGCQKTELRAWRSCQESLIMTEVLEPQSYTYHLLSKSADLPRCCVPLGPWHFVILMFWWAVSSGQ